jgi:phage-related protein
MSSIGAGVNEIRVHVDGEHRVLYVAKFEDAIYVLHAFRKTTRKTPKPVLELAAQRYRAVLEERKRVKKR